GAGNQLFQQEDAAETAEDLDGGAGGGLENARRLERRRRVLELDRARGRDFSGDAREERRLHGEAGDRRVVLHDNRQIDRVGQRPVVRDDGGGGEVCAARGGR